MQFKNYLAPILPLHKLLLSFCFVLHLSFSPLNLILSSFACLNHPFSLFALFFSLPFILFLFNFLLKIIYTWEFYICFLSHLSMNQPQIYISLPFLLQHSSELSFWVFFVMFSPLCRVAVSSISTASWGVGNRQWDIPLLCSWTEACVYGRGDVGDEHTLHFLHHEAPPGSSPNSEPSFLDIVQKS